MKRFTSPLIAGAILLGASLNASAAAAPSIDDYAQCQAIAGVGGYACRLLVSRDAPKPGQTADWYEENIYQDAWRNKFYIYEGVRLSTISMVPPHVQLRNDVCYTLDQIQFNVQQGGTASTVFRTANTGYVLFYNTLCRNGEQMVFNIGDAAVYAPIPYLQQADDAYNDQVHPAIENGLRLVFDQINALVDVVEGLPCVDNPVACAPTGAPGEVADELEALIAQAQQAISEAEAEIQAVIDGVDPDGLAEEGQEQVQATIDNTFDNLNSTLGVIFAEVNYLIEQGPEEVRETAQFAVDLATAEIDLLLGQVQNQAEFLVGLSEEVVGMGLEMAELVYGVAQTIVNAAPIYGVSEDYNTLLDQIFFAIDGLVLSRLDPERPADNAVIVFVNGFENILRAADGYGDVVQEDLNVDGNVAIDTTLHVTGATVFTIVELGFALLAGSGHEAIYEDLVCNRLDLCEQ